MQTDNQRAERWGEIETLTMLTIMQELNIVQLLAKHKRHSFVFGKISESMAERGFQRTANHIKTRWRNLKSIYGDAKRKLKISGLGNRKPRFYDEMDEILGSQPACEIASDETMEALANGEPEILEFEHLEPEFVEHNSTSDSQTTPERPPSPCKSPSRNRRLVKERVRSGRQISFDDSLKSYALLNKELLTELFTNVNKDSQEFIAAEMEKQRTFEKELLEAHHSHMQASMEAMMQMFLSSQSPPTLLSQQSGTSGEGGSR